MSSASVPQIFRTPRLTLRPLRTDDRYAIAEGVGNYEVSRWLSVVPYPYDLSDADAFLADTLGKARPVWAICDTAGLAGLVSVGDEFGYWLARPVWGQGYATEAGDAAIDAHFADSDKDRLCANCFVGNGRSHRVLKKLGFRDIGMTRIDARSLSQTVDAIRLELTRDEWRQRRRFHVATQRIEIDEVHDTDWPALQRLGGVPDVARMLLSVKSPWSEAEVRQWIARATYRGRPGFRATMRLRDGSVIGSLGLGRNPGAAEMSCYYWLGRPFWGQGYATEAMRGFLLECYARFPDLDGICADHFTDNPASGHVLRKLGFERIGEGRGHSAARLEPAPEVHYRLSRATFRDA